MNKLNKGKRLIVTLMSSGMATVMSFVVSFFLTPFITNMLGTEAYGFVTLSKNFVSYAVIISTALDSYATRYIAMEYHKRDFDKANSYVSSAFYGDTVIASIILAVGVIFVLFMCNKISHFPLDTATLLAYNYAIFFQLLWLLYRKLRRYASEKGEIQEKLRRVIKLKRNERKSEIQTRKRRP